MICCLLTKVISMFRACHQLWWFDLGQMLDINPATLSFPLLSQALCWGRKKDGISLQAEIKTVIPLTVLGKTDLTLVKLIQFANN